MSFSSEKINYINNIQNVINRMAANSAAIKNWFIVSVGGLLAIYYTQNNGLEILILAFIITLAFYWFDIYYLWLERVFREKYSQAVEEKSALFDMNIEEIKKVFPCREVAYSFSMLPYWAASLLILCLIFRKLCCICF